MYTVAYNLGICSALGSCGNGSRRSVVHRRHTVEGVGQALCSCREGCSRRVVVAGGVTYGDDGRTFSDKIKGAIGLGSEGNLFDPLAPFNKLHCGRNNVLFVLRSLVFFVDKGTLQVEAGNIRSADFGKVNARCADDILLADGHCGGVPGGGAAFEIILRHLLKVCVHSIPAYAPVAVSVYKSGVNFRAAKINPVACKLADIRNFSVLYGYIHKLALM